MLSSNLFGEPTVIYLIRHGQAGLRQQYDRLSELGCRQAEALGAWFAGQGIGFDRILSGALERQKETARRATGQEPEALPGWNEFDLDALFLELAPKIADRDARFKQEYEEMLQEQEDAGASVHRRWTRCDMEVVRAWIAGEYPTQTESWLGFQERVRAAFRELLAGAGGRVALFTSATPIGLAVASLLEADGRHALRLAGAQMNTAFTVAHRREGEASLFQFNVAPHLEDPQWRTFR
jgi:broad specificity phosphatase PhoE